MRVTHIEWQGGLSITDYSRRSSDRAFCSAKTANNLLGAHEKKSDEWNTVIILAMLNEKKNVLCSHDSV